MRTLRLLELFSLMPSWKKTAYRLRKTISSSAESGTMRIGEYENRAPIPKFFFSSLFADQLATWLSAVAAT